MADIREEIMGFSKEIRTRALVAAARRCCLCRRFKGVKVEVHHIVPQSKGGKDDFDNAIVLCFDCHADVGNYNPEHPRGNRFAPEELRAHRDRWYRLVESNNIHPPEDEDFLLCQYLVCKSFDVLREVTDSNLEHLPFPECLLSTNRVLEFHRDLVASHPGPHRSAQQNGDWYESRDIFWAAHPEANTLDTSGLEYPCFEAQRTPTYTELKNHVCSDDPLTAALLDAQVPTSEIGKAFLYEEVCGDEGQPALREMYRLRPLWTVYLAVRNISDKPLTLKSLEGRVESADSLNYRRFKGTSDEGVRSSGLPQAPVGCDMTVIIPVATALAPLDTFTHPIWFSTEEGLPTGEDQELIHTSFEKTAPEFNLIGPAIWPTAILVEAEGFVRTQHIHELDLSNLYAIDRHWHAGSCPYLLFQSSETGTVAYVRQLFGGSSRIPSEHTIRAPSWADEIIIAELEEEDTYIDEMCVNRYLLTRNLHLSKGDVFRCRISPRAIVYLKGFYVPHRHEANSTVNPWRRNELVSRFLARAAQAFSNGDCGQAE